MLLFPSISGRTMARTLLPYILGILAVAAVMTAYLAFTSSTADMVDDHNSQHAVKVAKQLASILVEGGLSPEMFVREETEGYRYLTLSDYYSDLLGLVEMQVIEFDQVPSTGIPFEEDSLLISAMASMEPRIQYSEVDKRNRLLLIYPMQDGAGRPVALRLVFQDVLSRSMIMEGRYSMYLAAAAVILLLLLPGIFLKLAEIRRQIEKTGFYRSESDIAEEKSVQIVRADISPSFLLEGKEFPALFRLDENGTILYMNRSAERLTDLTREDVKGSMFHELPCFPDSARERITYPQDGDPLEIGIDVLSSSGASRGASFRIERLGRTGYGVSAFFGRRDEDLPREPSQDHEVKDSAEVLAEGMTQESYNRVIALLNEGRARFRNDEQFIEHMGRIYDTMVEGGHGAVPGEDDTATTIELYSELDAISSALNDVLPERASIELDVPGFLPAVECSRQDFTQLVKNLVFHSLETTAGPVRIRIGTREVHSPVSDSVFSANCDRTVPRSVSISYSDGTRIPAVLKEALMDPETDLSGIRRDYGSHISSVAAILARLDSHPVFTEGSSGSTLHLLLRISEELLFDQHGAEDAHTVDLSSIRLIVCDASRAVRESVCDAISLFHLQASGTGDLEEARAMISDMPADFLVLDHSAILDPIDEVLEDLGRAYAGLRIILTMGLQDDEIVVPDSMEQKVRIIEKPYTIDDILNIVELTTEGQNPNDTAIAKRGSDQ